MSGKQIQLSYDQLRAVARYEMTFRDILTDGENFNEIEFAYPEPYAYTLADLRCAVSALKRINPTCQEFDENWFNPITELSEAFGVDHIRFPEKEERPVGFETTAGMPLTESDVFDDVWTELEIAWEDGSGENPVPVDWDDLLAEIDRYYQNRDKPVEEREFDLREKRYFIMPYGRDEKVKKATERELALCRKFVNELCAEDDDLALRIKGYSCYGGDRLFSCDWEASRDCISRLFEKTGDPQYANTLGYIFYYGRCTGGVPDYDKAFKYYSLAAASGLYEGMYKIADMFLHGYGCIRSPQAAKKLYSLVYDDSRRAFLQGSDANFADIALRMGNVYARNDDGEKNESIPEDQTVRAYGYYMEAACASDIRIRSSDFFGYGSVADGIRKAIEEIRAGLPGDFFVSHMDFRFPVPFEDLTEDHYLCELKRIEKPDGSVWLKAKRLPFRRENPPAFIFLEYPKLRICERVRKVTMEVIEEREFWTGNAQGPVRYDFLAYNGRLNRVEFFDRGELTAWIRAESLRLHGKPDREPRGPEYRIVSVRFQPGGKTYDYLTDLRDLQAGDTVIVNGYDGETAVTVTAVTIRKESELPLPIDRYKKILRKAETRE